jgi:hypothetical protein
VSRRRVASVWGPSSLAAVGGVWAVVAALAAAIVTLISVNYRRLPGLRESLGAGANASVLPALSVASLSLVGFGALVAALPAFAMVRDWVLSVEGGPLVSLSISTNLLAALTGSASGGMTIALDALGDTYMRIAAEEGTRSRAHAQRSGDRCGDARQPATQRCGCDAARRLRINASQELLGYSYGGDRERASRPRGGHRTGFSIWILLSQRCGIQVAISASVQATRCVNSRSW